MPAPERPALLGVLALIGTAVLWGANHVVARGSNEIVPLAALVFWRWALALVPMVMICWPSLRRHRTTIRDNLGDLCLIGTIGVGVFSALLIAGAYHSRAVEVSMINATTPAWVAVIGLIRGDARLALRQWAGLALAFAGTLLILSGGDPAQIVALEARLGNVMALVAAVLFAWFSTRLRRYSGVLPPLTLTTVTACFGTGVVALPFFLVSWLILNEGIVANAPSQTDIALLIVLFSALGPTLLGNAFFIYGLSVIGPQRAAAFLYLAPVASSVLAVLFLDERLQWFHFAGYGLIVLGLVLVNRTIRTAAPRV